MAGVKGEPVRVEDQVTPRTEMSSLAAAPPEAAVQDDGFQVVDPFEQVLEDGSKTPSLRMDDVRGLYHVAQLRDELAEAAEQEGLQVALVLENPYAESSESNPDTLFIHPSVDKRLAKKVVAAHQADDQHGMSDAQKAWPEVKKKIQAGEELSGEELRQALSLMAERL